MSAIFGPKGDPMVTPSLVSISCYLILTVRCSRIASLGILKSVQWCLRCSRCFQFDHRCHRCFFLRLLLATSKHNIDFLSAFNCLICSTNCSTKCTVKTGRAYLIWNRLTLSCRSFGDCLLRRIYRIQDGSHWWFLFVYFWKAVLSWNWRVCWFQAI